MIESRLLHYTPQQIAYFKANPSAAPVGFNIETGQQAATDSKGRIVAKGMNDQQVATMNAPQNTTPIGITTQADANLYRGDNLQGALAPKVPQGYIDTSKLVAYGPEGHGGVAETPEQFAARVAAANQSNAALLQQQATQQQMAQSQADRQATAGAASAAAAAHSVQNPVSGKTYTGGAAERLQTRLDQGSAFKNPQDKAQYIEQRRAQGATDAQIRAEIATAPQYSTPETAAPTPASTTAKPTATSTATSKDGKTEPQGPPPHVAAKSNLIRNLAATEQDPYMQAVMMAEADLIDANPDPGNPMSFSQFNATEGKAIGTPYDAIAEIVNNARTRAQNNEDSTKAFLKDQLDRTNEFNTLQEANLKAQLQFQQDQAVRESKDALKKNLDSQTIRLALGGGFGSEDGNREIDEARLKGEQAITDLKKEFGFKMADVSLQFTQMHNEAYDRYQQAWLEAADRFETRIGDLDIQGITNQASKASAIKGAYQDYVKDIKDARKDHAKALVDANKMVLDMHNAARDDQRAQETLGWNVLDKAIDDYGDQIPQSLLDRISKMIPGVDLKDVAKAKTLAQQKLKKGGGGGEGFGFSISQLTPTGQAQTLDQFLATKESDWHKTGQQGPVSPQQRESWKKEYTALAAENAKLSPTQILKEFEIKSAQNGVFQTKYQAQQTEAAIKNAISTGDFVQARNIVDGIGRPPPEKTAARISNLQRLEVSLNEMDQLLDQIQGNVGPFPTEGPLWSWMNEHLETTPEYQRMLTLRNTNLAPYSRSVSGETGASSEGDVARAVSGLLQSNVSAPAMRAALNEAKKQSQMAITMYLKSMRDSGYAVQGLQNTYDSGSWNPSSSFTLSPAQQEWLSRQ